MHVSTLVVLNCFNLCCMDRKPRVLERSWWALQLLAPIMSAYLLMLMSLAISTAAAVEILRPRGVPLSSELASRHLADSYGGMY